MSVKVPKSWLWRAIKAKCYDCRAGYRGMDCEIPTCPLYLFLKQGELEPVLWWHKSAHKWAHVIGDLVSYKMKLADEEKDAAMKTMFSYRSIDDRKTIKSRNETLRPVLSPPRRRYRL